MAEIWLADDLKTTERVVLKRLLPHLAREPEFVTMFLEEAKIAAQLQHKNIVEILDLGRYETNIFIVMEYVRGVDLRKIVNVEKRRESTMPAPVAAWVMARLCDALDYAHNAIGNTGEALRVIHRDVSPQNVMLTFRGVVKLVDFGIAKVSTSVETQPGVVKGKVEYLAPEQIHEPPKADERSDIWAVGATLYELMTGASPFARNNIDAILFAIRQSEPIPPHLARENVSTELSRIALKCLKKKPRDRYSSAAALAHDLRSFLHTLDPLGQADIERYLDSVLTSERDRNMIMASKENVVPFDEESTAPGAPPSGVKKTLKRGSSNASRASDERTGTPKTVSKSSSSLQSIPKLDAPPMKNESSSSKRAKGDSMAAKAHEPTTVREDMPKN